MVFNNNQAIVIYKECRKYENILIIREKFNQTDLTLDNFHNIIKIFVILCS